MNNIYLKVFTDTHKDVTVPIITQCHSLETLSEWFSKEFEDHEGFEWDLELAMMNLFKSKVFNNQLKRFGYLEASEYLDVQTEIKALKNSLTKIKFIEE